MFNAADEVFELPRGQYLELEVTSSSGDVEKLRLRRYLCFTSEGAAYACRMFSVEMETGGDVRSIENSLNAVGAHLNLVSGGGRAGSFFASGSVSKAREAAESIDGVLHSDRIFLLTIGGPVPPLRTWVGGAVPFRHAAGAQYDGTLGGVPGDTLTFVYAQPSGSTLSASVVVPSGLP